MTAPKKEPVEHYLVARVRLLEMTLIDFIESLDGKVPTDPEILAHGYHLNFAATPLSVYEKDGFAFATYYVWRNEHVLAYGFLDPQRPLDLQVTRLPREEWPAALRLMIEQHIEKQQGGQ